jgi:pSer/pThr/pTyr-binding forkhead associated (FHA) protein
MAGRLYPAGGGASISLGKKKIVIGRALGCDIRMEDAVVSNCHCILEFDGTNWTVKDPGSRNGTMVNGVRLADKVVLKSGDTLIISAKYRFVIEYSTSVERQRFAEAEEQGARHTGDVRTYVEHGPATKRLEPHDKDIWSKFEK